MTKFNSLPQMQSPMILPPGNYPPLYLPRGSRDVPASDWHTVRGPILDAWQDIARDKGFSIDRRVRDRYHVVLQ